MLKWTVQLGAIDGEQVMKKVMIGYFVGLIAFAMLICLGEFVKEKQRREAELPWLYERQNRALGLCTAKESRYYHNGDELDLQMMTLSLYVYSLDKPDNTLSISEIEEYLSKEYSDNGKLMLYSCPDSISNYIDWWWDGGQSDIIQFYTKVSVYMHRNGYDGDLEDYSVEELQEIFPLVRTV